MGLLIALLFVVASAVLGWTIGYQFGVADFIRTECHAAGGKIELVNDLPVCWSDSEGILIPTLTFSDDQP